MSLQLIVGTYITLCSALQQGKCCDAARWNTHIELRTDQQFSESLARLTVSDFPEDYVEDLYGYGEHLRHFQLLAVRFLPAIRAHSYASNDENV
jgi:hypothetical protein